MTTKTPIGKNWFGAPTEAALQKKWKVLVALKYYDSRTSTNAGQMRDRAKYKKDSRLKYSYSYRCEARAFVNTLATNEFFKSRLIREIWQIHIVNCSSLTVHYDWIEVNNGFFWSIKRRDFVNSAIQARPSDWKSVT